jgi:hypothetical protein
MLDLSRYGFRVMGRAPRLEALDYERGNVQSLVEYMLKTFKLKFSKAKISLAGDRRGFVASNVHQDLADSSLLVRCGGQNFVVYFKSRHDKQVYYAKSPLIENEIDVQNFVSGLYHLVDDTATVMKAGVKLFDTTFEFDSLTGPMLCFKPSNNFPINKVSLYSFTFAFSFDTSNPDIRTRYLRAESFMTADYAICTAVHSPHLIEKMILKNDKYNLVEKWLKRQKEN